MPAQSSWFCFVCLRNMSNRSFSFCDGRCHGHGADFESISTYISQKVEEGVLDFDSKYGFTHRVCKQLIC